MRAIKILLFLVVFLPIIAMVGMQGFVGYTTYSQTQKVHSALKQFNEKPKPYVAKMDVQNHLGSRRRAKPGYLSILEPAALDELRRFSLRMEIPVGTLLKPGEAMPDSAFREVFVKARSPGFAEKECALLKVALMRKCQLGEVQTNMSKDGKTVSIHASYDFVQKPPTGRIDKDASLRYDEIEQRIDEPVDGSARRTRERTYFYIAHLCDQLRQSHGSCGLHRVILSLKEHRSGERLSGEVKFGMLQRRG